MPNIKNKYEIIYTYFGLNNWFDSLFSRTEYCTCDKIKHIMSQAYELAIDHTKNRVRCDVYQMSVFLLEHTYKNTSPSYFSNDQDSNTRKICKHMSEYIDILDSIAKDTNVALKICKYDMYYDNEGHYDGVYQSQIKQF